ncbi:MAG: hypothetical protein ACE5KW_01590 [Dehalococcoidia bacterium]
MTIAARLLFPLLAGLALVLAACGEDGAITSPTPPLTPTLAPTVTPTPTAGEAPRAAPVRVRPGQKRLGGSVLELVLEPGGNRGLNPVELARGVGIIPPPCASLLFLFSWQVRQPYPPGDIILQFVWTRMGQSDLVAEATSGQAKAGCGLVEAVSNSDGEVTLELRYVIAEAQG